MSKCSKIRELLLTDYADGEVDAETKEKVERHLESCLECRAFEKKVMDTIKPFEGSEIMEPGPETWQKIRETLQPEAAGTVIDRILDAVRPILIRPRPALALASVAVIMVVGILFTRISWERKEGVNAYLQQQVRFFDYLESNGGNYPTTDHLGIKSPLEKYFFNNGNFLGESGV